MPISSPVRASDFINSEKAQFEWVEEICAIGRIPPADVEPFPGVFLLRLTHPDRVHRWWSNRNAVDHHLFVDSSIVDRFGTTLQVSVSRQTGVSPKECYAVVTSWRDVCQGAQYLRTKYLANAFGGDSTIATENFVATITDALQIQERPVNSPLLPAWCPMKWGALLRLDPPTVARTLDYLLLERPAQGELSPLVPLGAGVVSRVAASPSPEEPVQVGISSQWNDDLLSKTLARWLRGFQTKPDDRQLTTAS